MDADETLGDGQVLTDGGFSRVGAVSADDDPNLRSSRRSTTSNPTSRRTNRARTEVATLRALAAAAGARPHPCPTTALDPDLAGRVRRMCDGALELASRLVETWFDAQITFVYVDDLARAAAFYGGVLDLELVRDQGACLIYRVAADAYLGVCDHRPSSPGGVIITLVTDDVDSWAHRLGAAGYVVDGPTANERFELYHCFVHDPDGHLVEIQRFDEPL